MQVAGKVFTRSFTNTVTWLFIFLWIYAASSKLLDYPSFTVQLRQSPLVNPVAGFVAWFVPLIEILTAMALLSERTRLGGLYVSLGLMAMFSVYIVAITRFSDYIPCSCGGILEKLNWNQHLVFNLILVMLAFMSILLFPENDISLQQIRGSRKPV